VVGKKRYEIGDRGLQLEDKRAKKNIASKNHEVRSVVEEKREKSMKGNITKSKKRRKNKRQSKSEGLESSVGKGKSRTKKRERGNG